MANVKQTYKYLLALVCMIGMGTTRLHAQKIFSVDREYQADVKVFVVDTEYKADLIVFKTDKEYKAKKEENKGIWFVTDKANQADKKYSSLTAIIKLTSRCFSLI